MYTCCPHCQTCFRITKAQLDVAQGKVRCGHCKQVFNGKQHLREELPGKQNKPDVSDTSTTPVSPEVTPSKSDVAPAKATDIDFDLFDLSSIPASHPEDEAWLEDADESTDNLDSDAWLEEDTFDEEEDDVTANLDEPYEEPDEIYEEPEEVEEEDDVFSDIEAEPKVEPKEETTETPLSSRYAYFDPEDQVGEQQDIEKFIEEMNAQLAEVVEKPIDIQAFESDVDVDLSTAREAVPDKTDNIIEPEEKAPEQPVASTTDDEFKQAFLDNLDSTLALQPSPPPPAESPPLKPEIKPVSKPPAAHVPPATARPTVKPESKTKSEAVPFRLRDSLAVKTKPHRPLWLVLGITGILFFSASLFVQLAFFRSSQLLDRFPTLQPLVERICTTLPCRYSGPRDISQIKLVNRDIRVHPKVKNALLISATFINRAPFKQPYPDITISLSDLSGALVAQRRFTPAEYLGRLNSPFLLMPSGKPVQIALEVVDPGKDAVNFEFTFQ
ncbi:MAG: DUF3426 domain-containing protein [Thiohalomonadales bacterium]|nr:DUF3426 domain-containing protein [Thiohalomonadales bacterium]